MIEIYTRAIKNKFGSDAEFQRHLGKSNSSFKRRLETFIIKVHEINKYLSHLNLEFRLCFRSSREEKRRQYKNYFSIDFVIQEAKMHIALISNPKTKKTSRHIACENALNELKKENPDYEKLNNLKNIK